jgi:RNA polymerase sigma-70 factor (ECF subfamily)
VSAAAPIARVRLDDEVVGVGLIAALADRLDDGHLEVLVCRFVDDMTQEEIAAQLGLSRKTIGKRLDRIRAEVIALREEKAS